MTSGDAGHRRPAANHSPPAHAGSAGGAHDPATDQADLTHPFRGRRHRARPGAQKIWGGLLLVALALVIVDILLTQLVENRAGSRIGEELQADVSVSLRGWPVMPRLLLSGLPRADVAATDVPLNEAGAMLRTLQLRLSDVRVNLSGEVFAGAASFTSQLHEDDVEALVVLPAFVELTEIRLGDGVAEALIAGIPLVEATAAVRDGEVVLNAQLPVLGEVSFPVNLEGLPEQVEITGVAIRPGRLDLAGTARNVDVNELR